jgi:hypothetical protein
MKNCKNAYNSQTTEAEKISTLFYDKFDVFLTKF